MKAETMNIAYIALELTKIYIENMPKDKCIFSKETVGDTYNHYLADLFGLEDLDKFKETQRQLEEITEKYNDLRENMEAIIADKVADRVTYKKDRLKHILEATKGDMEPYVYESLIKLVK